MLKQVNHVRNKRKHANHVRNMLIMPKHANNMLNHASNVLATSIYLSKQLLQTFRLGFLKPTSKFVHKRQ